MESRRRACLVFGGVVGAALVLLVAHYGYISSDDHKAGLIVAFLYGSIAFAGMFGHGLCVLVWKRSRFWASLGVLVLGSAAIVNISNSRICQCLVAPASSTGMLTLPGVC